MNQISCSVLYLENKANQTPDDRYFHSFKAIRSLVTLLRKKKLFAKTA